MSNGTIITPLIPDENIEINQGTPNDIYTPSDSPDNQTKEAPKLVIKKFSKKWNCFEILFLFFFLIIILSTLTSIIIQIAYHIIPVITIIYSFFSFLPFLVYCEMIQKQDYSASATILVLLIIDASIFWSFDFFSILENDKHIREKNEFIANSLKYLKFGEISIWILLIFLLMYLTYKRTGKIWFDK